MHIEVVSMPNGADIPYTKGHVDLDAFLAEAREFAENDSGNKYFQAVEARYVWIRKRPDVRGRYYYIVEDGTPGKQGTFPATAGINPDSWPYPFKAWPRKPEDGLQKEGGG